MDWNKIFDPAAIGFPFEPLSVIFLGLGPSATLVKAFNSPAVRNGFSRQFANILKPTAAATGDILIEGAEEGMMLELPFEGTAIGAENLFRVDID